MKETSEKSIEELKEENLRLLAEFENIKKHLKKEKELAEQFAFEHFAKDMLLVADSLENAAKSIQTLKTKSKKNVKEIRKGIRLTLSQLERVFKKHGIEKIKARKKFDPYKHNAVLEEYNPKRNSGEISRELQAGYKIKDRILRPSMVAITKKSTKEEK